MFRHSKDATAFKTYSVTKYLKSFVNVCSRLKTDKILYIKGITYQFTPKRKVI